MRDWNAKDVAELLRESGRMAMEHYDNPAWELKADRSIVTVADKAIENFLGQEFDRPAEGVFMIGEETAATHDDTYWEGALNQTAWIVDPIDGTAPYAHHIPTWGVSIGHMRGGRIDEGGIFLPATGELFVTDGDALLVQPPGRPLEPLEIHRRTLGDDGMVALPQSLAKQGRINLRNPVQALCCAVMPLAYLCAGRYLAYVGNLYLWDFAAGIAMVEKAGFVAKTLDGTPMTLRPAADCRPGEPGIRRWKSRAEIVFAPDHAIADFIIEKIAATGS